MQQFINAIAYYLEIESDDLKPTAELRELVDDSLDFIELILHLEETFNINIHDDDLDHILTVQNLLDYLSKTVSSK